MADNQNTVLPVMPITWAILAVLVLASYLISKLADLCFDHYLINYTNYEHRHMIEARFKGELKKFFLFKKKDDDKEDTKSGQKISILPTLIDDTKREVKRAKKLDDSQNTDSNNNSNNTSDNNNNINNNTKLVEENEVKKNQQINNKNKTKFNNKTINNPKLQNRSSNPSLKSASRPKISITRSNTNPSLNLNTNKNKNVFTNSVDKSPYNTSLLSTSRSDTQKPLVKIDESQQETESSNSNINNNNKNSKNPALVQLWGSHPYNEKFTEKHHENKRKLLKEKLKIFTVHKNQSSIDAIKLQNEEQIAIINELKLLDSSLTIANNTPMPDIVSITDSSFSDNSNFMKANDNFNSKVNSNEQYQQPQQPKKKKILVKQSTVETMLSSENHYK